MQRRTITQRSSEDWESLILSCLLASRSKDWDAWGCLNKQGELFIKRKLTKVSVPKGIVEKMCRHGVIKLDNEGFYRYIEPRSKRVITRSNND